MKIKVQSITTLSLIPVRRVPFSQNILDIALKNYDKAIKGWAGVASRMIDGIKYE